jgi:peptidoglycan-associated lipoprotein
MSRLSTLLLSLTLAAGLAACASDPQAVSATGPGGGAGGAGGLAGGSLDPRSPEYFSVTVGDRVFFETDSSSLDDIAVGTLTRQAQWLAQNPGAAVTIEGHADERGTREYNLALGARRAQAARDFLAAQGVAPGRMRTVSYGKERPVAPGSDPASWAQNRRAVTVVAGAPTS